MLGLAAAFSPGTNGEAFADSQSNTAQKENTMTQSSATQRGSEQAADKTAIRPFQVNVPEAELAELRSVSRDRRRRRYPVRQRLIPEAAGFALGGNAKALRRRTILDHRKRSPLHWHARLCPGSWIAGRLEASTLHSAFAATDDGGARGDGARRSERATTRTSLVKVGE